MILMDTSFLILLARGSPRVVGVLDRINREGGALTSISYFEVFRSRRKMSKKEAMFFTQLFTSYPLLSLDARSAEEAAGIWEGLEKIGRVVNVIDVLIAGSVVAHGVETVATSDRDFLEIAKVVDIEVLLV